MATFTWKGSQGTGSDPNDASVAANWITSDGTTSLPGASDSIVEQAGTAAAFTLDVLAGQTLVANSVTIGTVNSGTLIAQNDTLNLTGATVSGGSITIGDNATPGTPVVLNATTSTIGSTSLSLGSGDVLNFRTSTVTGMPLTLSTSDTLTVTGGTLSNATIQTGTATASGDVINLTTAAVSGLTLTAAGGLALNINDTTLVDPDLTLGNGSTITASGDDAQTGTVISNGVSVGSVPGVVITGNAMIAQSGTASTLTLNAQGNVQSDAIILAASPGGSLVINATTLSTLGGPIPGSFENASALIGVGESVSITTGSDASFTNRGIILIDAGVISLQAAQQATTGVISLLNGSTADIAGGLIDTETLVFDDATNGLLQIQGGSGGLQAFNASIAGFQAGDTIEIAGITGLSQSYADGVLTLSQSSTIVGTLRFSGNEAPDSALGADGFSIAASAGNSFITIAATNDALGTIASGTTVDWSNPAIWAGGTLPGSQQVAGLAQLAAGVAGFAAGGSPGFTLTVHSAETAGAVVLDDNLGTFDINAPLTLAAQPSASSGGSFLQTGGKLNIGSNATLSATSFVVQNGKLQIAGTLDLSGQAPAAAVDGWLAMDLENVESNVTIEGRINAAGGGIDIGESSISTVTLENGGTVLTTFTQLGGAAYGDGDLSISGAGTVWKDLGDPGNTLDASPYLGDMVLGGGQYDPYGTIETPDGANGFGGVFVENGGTLIDANWGVLGVTGFGAANRGQANAIVDNGAVWNTGQGIEVGGSHLYPTQGGAGILNIMLGGTANLGSGATGGLYKLAVAVTPGSQGTVEVDGQGFSNNPSLLNAQQGPAVIGEDGSGSVTVSNGATAEVGTNSNTGFGWSVMIGDAVGSIGGITVDSGSTLTSSFTAGGDIIDGDNGTGGITISGGGVLSTTGELWLGGTGGGQGLGSGALRMTGGEAAIQDGLQMWRGSAISISGAAELELGNAANAVAGEIVVDPGQTLNGAGSIEISSLSSALDNNGVVRAGVAGQTLDLGTDVQLVGSGVYQIAAGATLRLENGSGTAATFDFGSGSGRTQGTVETLQFVASNMTAGTIGDFYGNDRIDAASVLFASDSPTLEYNPANGSLELRSTAGTLDFVVTGAHPSLFTIEPDGGVGTAVIAEDAPCFVAGTRILTVAGEVAVDALRPGDVVPTLSGRLRRVRWIGRTRIDLARHPDPGRAAPVRVAAGAFAPDVPHRDLLLSPDHALWVDGALIPAWKLANGATIARVPGLDTVEYLHVELDAHDILLAEGLPAESYLDTGNRGQFAGEAGVRAVSPDLLAELSARSWDDKSCAPLLLGGAVVKAAHARLLARAQAVGWVLDDDPALRIDADGTELAQTQTAPGLWRGTLPAGTTTLRLRSRGVVPADVDCAVSDGRRLGVAIGALLLNGAPVALRGNGLHAAEAGWCWTCGDATLLLPARPEPVVLELRLHGGMVRYWVRGVAGHDRLAA